MVDLLFLGLFYLAPIAFCGLIALFEAESIARGIREERQGALSSLGLGILAAVFWPVAAAGFVAYCLIWCPLWSVGTIGSAIVERTAREVRASRERRLEGRAKGGALSLVDREAS